MADNVTVEVLDAGNAVEVEVGTGGNIPSKWSVWNGEDHYVPLRSVTHLGSAYVCIKACTGVDPEADVALGDGVEGEYWIKTASKGDTGATPRLQMGTVETLEPEEAAKATITGTAEDPILNLQLPKGRQGDKGEKGDKGDKGDTGEKGEKGDTGATGPQGLQGPRGLKGDTGAQGAQGVPGADGATGPKGDTGAKGDKGDKGEKGDKGDKGDKGEDGEGGISRWWKINQASSGIQGEVVQPGAFVGAPTIDDIHLWDIVLSTVDGALMPVDHIFETTPFGVPAVGLGMPFGRLMGYDEDPEDGFSPTVEVTAIAGGHRVTITDAEGTHTFDVMDGEKGADGVGVPGKDGKDGVSVTHSWNGTVLNITSASGTSSADLRGPAGADGKDGAAGKDGSPGAAGTDGFSPKVAVTEIAGGHRVTITDAEGTHTFDVMDGADGEGGTGGNASGTGLQAIALDAGADLNDLDTTGKDVVRVFQDQYVVNPVNAPAGKENGYCPTIINVKTGLYGNGCLLQYWIAPADNFKPRSGKVEVYCRSVDPINKVGLTEWSKVYPAEGGGSGGGVKSWNDLEDRPFGEEKGLVEIYTETTVTISENQGMLATKVLEAGKTYFVNWEGTEYECVAENRTFDGIPAVSIGNPVFTGGSNNNMPFAIGYAESYGMSLAVAFADGDYTFSVKTEGVIVKSIDPKFLPKALQFGEKEGLVEVYPETMVTVTDNQAILDKNIALEVGKTYFVTWDGTEYECVAENVSFEGAPGIAVGNPYFTGGSNNGMPFAIGHSDYAGVSLAVAMTDGDHTFSVKIEGVIIKTINKKYLPPDIGSGGGSNIIADEVLPETTVTCTANGIAGGALITTFIAVPGKTYLVTYDGTEYECVAQQPNVSGYYGYVVIGSLQDLGAAGNREPFGLLIAEETAMLIGTAGTHTVRVAEAPVQKPVEIVVDLTSASSMVSDKIILPEETGIAEHRYVTPSRIVAPDLRNLLWAKKHDISVKFLFNLAGTVTGLTGGTTQVVEGSDPCMRCSFLYSFAPSVGDHEFNTYVINVEIPLDNLSAYVYISKLH